MTSLAKTISFLPFLLFSFQSRAEECKAWPQIQMPGYALEQFYNPRHNSASQFLPMPSSACLKVEDSIKIMDPYGRLAGHFQVRKIWKGQYNLSSLANLKPTEVAKEYELYLQKNNLKEDSLEAFLRLVFAYDGVLHEDIIQIAGGELRPVAGYALNWNSLTEPQNVKDVPIIGYADVIAQVGTASLIVDANPRKADPKNLWHIPQAEELALSNTSPRCGLWSWTELLSNWRGLNMDKYKEAKTRPAIVYSTHMDPSCALNAAAFLKLHGFTQVQWFEMASREWNRDRQTALKDRDISELKSVTATQLQNFLQDKNYAVIDIREPEKFAAGHIPGALNNPLSLASSSEFQKFAQKNPAWQGMLSTRVSLASYLVYPLTTQIKEAKNIIFYSGSFYPEDLTAAVGDVRRHFPKNTEVNVYVFPGGLAEWQSYSLWQPRGKFEIQK